MCVAKGHGGSRKPVDFSLSNQSKGHSSHFFCLILRAISGECLSSVMKENREDGGGEARAVAVSCSLVSRSLVSLHHLSLWGDWCSITPKLQFDMDGCSLNAVKTAPSPACTSDLKKKERKKEIHKESISSPMCTATVAEWGWGDYLKQLAFCVEVANTTFCYNVSER